MILKCQSPFNRNVIFNGDDGLSAEDHLEESMRLSTLKAKKDFPVWTLDLLAPFTFEEVSRLIIEVVLNSQDEMRLNMRSIFEVVSAVMALYPDSNLSQWKGEIFMTLKVFRTFRSTEGPVS